MNILYFASLKEKIGKDNEEIEILGEVSVKIVREVLSDRYGDDVIQKNILCAVNQEIVLDEHIIKPGDEVAFYPPVTGG